MRAMLSILVCAFSVFGTASFVQKSTSVVYLPLGDSYTICTGASEKESWPVILTAHLNDNKTKCVLATNPARNGYSTQDLIDKELPLVKKLKPDFVTVLIGVNDWVRHVPKATFSKNLSYILNEVQGQMENKKHIILITIPDFGVTAVGKSYSGGRDISAGLNEFNDVIKAEAKQRGLTVVDIFETSKKMGFDPALVASDGLHPSAKEYQEWEKLILPEAIGLLK